MQVLLLSGTTGNAANGGEEVIHANKRLRLDSAAPGLGDDNDDEVRGCQPCIIASTAHVPSCIFHLLHAFAATGLVADNTVKSLACPIDLSKVRHPKQKSWHA